VTSVRAGLGELTARELDLLVIGGGITGAGILRDAAMRGLRAALVDTADFGSGTSSRSSRLIHGGLRYLEHGHLGLVFEALRERTVLLRIAPHLVRPLPFLMPSYRGDRVPRWQLAAGLGLYTMLALGGNVARPRVFGKTAVLAREPNLRVRDLTGGGSFHDAQCDDARLVLATIRSATGHGALAANYVRATSLLKEDGLVVGADLADLITGDRATVRARVVVNATGPWADAMRRVEDPTATPLLRPTAGAHIVVRRERLGHTHAIIFTSRVDGRVMFVLPWGKYSHIGTTDTDYDGPPEQAKASRADILYLLRSANALFPHAHLEPEDVVATWAGVRALLVGPPGQAASAVSREHRVVTGPAGMITVAGGKLTTYRQMAAEAVDAVVQRLGGHQDRPPTDRDPLPGGETSACEGFRQAALDLGLPRQSADYLVGRYGTETAAVLNIGRDDRSLLAPVHPGHPAIGAEVVHQVRREFAVQLEDVLARRLRLDTETDDRGQGALQRVADLMGRELGWDAARIRMEMGRVSFQWSVVSRRALGLSTDD
jgi:glycerol-3-phosphate dehydrogenase